MNKEDLLDKWGKDINKQFIGNEVRIISNMNE